MKLALRPATEAERAFCEALTRSNLSAYLAARGIPWDAGVYRASWHTFENLMIVADDRIAGLLRLRAERDALEIRDLQVVAASQGQGVGGWAIGQAKALAADRGLDVVRLRVFEENPASALYARLGFEVGAVVAGKVEMTCAVPPLTRGATAASTGKRQA